MTCDRPLASNPSWNWWEKNRSFCLEHLLFCFAKSWVESATIKRDRIRTSAFYDYAECRRISLRWSVYVIYWYLNIGLWVINSCVVILSTRIPLGAGICLTLKSSEIEYRLLGHVSVSYPRVPILIFEVLLFA